jgi:hypothetical protein
LKFIVCQEKTGLCPVIGHQTQLLNHAMTSHEQHKDFLLFNIWYFGCSGQEVY